jgi:hypothetical protein
VDPASRSGGAPPARVDEALARARGHARLAAAEAAAALRALLDAAALAATGVPGDELRGIGALARRLEALDAAFRHGSAGTETLIATLAEALDAEIARWEARSAHDADARAVLRAFLGLRELLWELGVRPAGEAAAAPAGGAPAPRAAARGGVRAAPRVQRVPVEG